MPEFANKPIPVFAAMKDVIWKDEGRKEGDLLYTAELKRTARGTFGVVDAHAHVCGVTLCSGELTFSFQK